MKPPEEIKKNNIILRHINGLVILVAFLLAAYFIYFFAKPIYFSATDINLKINNLQNRKSAITKTISNLQAKDLIIEEERLNPVNRFFPSENDSLQMLSYIEIEAKNHSLNIFSLRTDSDQILENTNYYSIQGSFEGSFESIISFFSDIANSERAIGIKSINFNPQDEDGGKINISLEFVFPQIVVNAESTVDKAVTTFTSDEEKIIESLTARKTIPPSTASATFGKPNPFAKF